MKKFFTKHGVTAGKGAIVGSSMLIPGVSGGTMAIILGIYKALLHAVVNIRKEFRQSVIFLCEFCVGAGIGFLLFSRVVLGILNRFEIPTMYFFIGCVLGGLPLLISQSKMKDATPNTKIVSCIAGVVGLAIVLSLKFIPTGMFDVNATFTLKTIMIQLLTGVIIAAALVLPGISTSHMLLVMGMYTIVMEAAKNPLENVVFLALLGLSTIIGVFVITKPLEFFLDKYPQVTYLAIIGFVAGSVIDVFPGAPNGLELIASLITLCAGFLAIRYISKFSAE